MAFMIGSFAGGLWKGASSAMSLAREYQAFQQTQADFDAADQVKSAREGDASQTQPQVDTTKTGAGTPGTGDSGISTADSILPGPETFTTTSGPATSSEGSGAGHGPGPATKKAMWPATQPGGGKTGEPPPGSRPADQGVPGASTAPGSDTAGVKGAAGGPSGDPVYGPAGPPTTTGANAPPAPTDPNAKSPAPPASTDDKNGPITTPGGAPDPITRLGQTVGAIARKIPSGYGQTAPAGGPYGTNTYQPLDSSSAYPPQTTQVPDDRSAYPSQKYSQTGGAWAPATPAAPAQPFNAAGVKGQAGSPSGPAVTRPVAVDDQGRVIPAATTAAPSTAPQRPTAAEQPLTGANAVNYAVEQARKTGQDVPFGAGDEQMVAHPDGSIGTAKRGGAFRSSAITPASNQFAGPGAPTGDQQPPSPEVQGDVAAIQQGIQRAQAGGGPPPGTVAAAGPAAGSPPTAEAKPGTQAQTAAPAGTYDTPAGAITPAKAPTTAPAAQQQGAPGSTVKVAPTEGKGATTATAGGKVAPSQVGPSTQSEKTPPVLSPHVNPGYWADLQRQDPEYARLVQQVVDKVGGGHVSVENVAAILHRESGFNRNPAVGSYGEHGVMQVMPETQQAMMRYLGSRVNPDTVEGSLTLGVAYLRYLAVDKGLGDDSVQTNFAYMRGPGGAAQVARDGLAKSRQGPYGNALHWLDQMYGDHVQINDGMFTGGHDGPNSTHYAPDQLIRAGNGPGGPDALLNVVSTTGPAGLGMSGRWASAQAAVERAAIMKGDWNALPHISEWFAQQSHQGAVSNLIAAHAALSSGDGQGAINSLARAHAFFPDGIMGRFGLDKSGNVWAERFDEKSGERIGQPFQINAESLVPQIIRLQNPNNYIATLDAHRKVGAQMSLDASKANYYDTADQRETHKEELIGARESALETQRQGNRVDLQSQKDAAAAARAAGKGDKDYSDQDERQANTITNQAYKPDNKPDDVSDQQYTGMANLHSQLVKARRSGGSGMTSANAQMIANGVRTGNIKATPMRDANGNPGVGLYDKGDLNADGSPKEGAQPHAYLPKDAADRVLRGLVNPPAPKGNQRQAAISPVGSGLGTQSASQSGAGVNLANQAIPTSQPQQQTIAA